MTVSHVSATADLNAAADVLARAAEIVAHAEENPCSEDCLDAATPVCTCRCGGQNHQAGSAIRKAQATHTARQRDLRAGGTIARLVSMGGMLDTEDEPF